MPEIATQLSVAAPVDEALDQLRPVLAGWGYQLGRPGDPLLPLTVAQLMLANRSPHLQDMTTGLFDRVREQRLLEGARLNTVHAVQRVVAELGFCASRREVTAPPYLVQGSRAMLA